MIHYRLEFIYNFLIWVRGFRVLIFEFIKHYCLIIKKNIQYRKDSQISRTPSLATQILEKKFFMKKNLKEIQSRDHEVFCLYPRQTRQQWIEKYFKVLPVILAL